MSIAKMLQGLAGNEDFEELVIRQKLLAAKEELFLKNQVIVPEKSGEQIDIHEPVFFLQPERISDCTVCPGSSEPT